MVELDFTALHFSAGTRSHHFCRFMMWGSSHSRTDGSGAGIHLSFLHRLGLWCGTNGSTEMRDSEVEFVSMCVKGGVAMAVMSCSDLLVHAQCAVVCFCPE
ncbi:uncharacterized protein [Physcomitrium patens]|uniref:uncharacterized protein isoform X1 n=1 Tax=Physcomitrium patens TaxID=3218 RepID=UPI000D15275B|nr:uncharacterized protein LOC112274030 [Physcomitrium patens]|eukprot:XP_024358929.1 uncharacterized protein LOC112274030 [Physcomitrella patens]